jgi:hypothetical protein
MLIFIVSAAFAPQPLPAGPLGRPAPCEGETYEAQSARLEALADADQADREGVFKPGVDKRDLERRTEVGRLFASGCLQSLRDHANAALIYQHGDIPAHYYQAFVWSKRAMEMGGDERALWLLPRTIDRFLLTSGYRQFFGTNATRAESRTGRTEFCIIPVSERITDDQRANFGMESLDATFARLAQFNDSGEIDYCAERSC